MQCDFLCQLNISELFLLNLLKTALTLLLGEENHGQQTLFHF